GKTTLINVLSGAYRPTSGMGSLTGTDLAGFWGRPDGLANLGIARTFQTIRLMEDADAVTNVALGVKTEHARDRSTYAQRLLDSDGLGHISRRRVGELPYGIRRRVEIARALAREP